MTSDQILRQQLTNLLMVRQAHMSFEDAIKDFPEEHINTRPPDLDYTIWHLVDHIRICQWDILEYIRNPDYAAPDFPSGYWQPPGTTTDVAGWNNTIVQFQTDRQALVEIINDPARDLTAQIPHGQPSHNILREILIVADHNAYHIGEIGVLRQTLGLW